MRRSSLQFLAILVPLSVAYGVPPPTRQPEITAEELSWLAGNQYVKGSFDSAASDRPRKLRLILQRKGEAEVVLLPELSIPSQEHWKEFPTDFLFVATRQPDEQMKLFVAASNHSGRAHYSGLTDAFKACRVVCVKYLEDYKLTKGRHVLLCGDGGSGAGDPASADFQARVVVDVE